MHYVHHSVEKVESQKRLTNDVLYNGKLETGAGLRHLEVVYGRSIHWRDYASMQTMWTLGTRYSQGFHAERKTGMGLLAIAVIQIGAFNRSHTKVVETVVHINITGVRAGSCCSQNLDRDITLLGLPVDVV